MKSLPGRINAAAKRPAGTDKCGGETACGADKCGGEVACWGGQNRFIKINVFFCFLIQMGVFKGFS
jgi:hypothetical protein